MNNTELVGSNANPNTDLHSNIGLDLFLRNIRGIFPRFPQGKVHARVTVCVYKGLPIEVKIYSAPVRPTDKSYFV